jgi:hypothetical protein
MFTRKSVLKFAGLWTMAIATLAPNGAFAMRGAFDGSWMVQIITSRGTCSSGVGFGVQIRDGVVFADGVIDVHGNIAASGVTRVRIVSGSQSASGGGRLRGNSGSGTWQGVGSQGACSGSWSASRG